MAWKIVIAKYGLENTYLLGENSFSILILLFSFPSFDAPIYLFLIFISSLFPSKGEGLG